MREWLWTIAGGLVFILGFHALADADEPASIKLVVGSHPGKHLYAMSSLPRLPPTTTTTTTSSTTSTTTTTTTTTLPPPPPTTTTTLPPAPVIQEKVWQPADECRNISRPVSAAAMRWCPFVAQALHRTGQWKPGDLTKLMRIIDCESGGNPTAKNPRSTASGLFQFLDGSWARWGPRAARHFGFTNPQVFAGYDNIYAGVLYYVSAGPRPWPNCGRR